jgi:adenylate kinase
MICMRLVLLGPPGVGKGTQSARLVAERKIPHISTGDMLRQAIREQTAFGRSSREYIAQGQLVPDPIVLQLIGERLVQADCGGGYLLDGFPRTVRQAEALDEFLAERGTPLDAVLELTVDRQEIERRLSDRQREDDQPDVLCERLNAYAEQTAPLVDYYRQRGLLRTINGLGTPDEVFGRICRALQQLTP